MATADPAVAQRITALQQTWTAFTTPQTILRAPGSVKMLMPVDATSATPIVVPGRIIKFLGITKDTTGSKFDRIFQYNYTPVANKKINVRPRKTRYQRKTPTTYVKEVIVNLRTPIPYTINSTRVQKDRILTQVSLRVPSYVSNECVTWWLYNEPSADKRPLTFENENLIYQVWDIQPSDLGELPDDTEKPDAQQAQTGPGAVLQP